MDNYFKKIKSQKGFGLLETVIALGILMMGVIGFTTLTVATIVTSRTSELRITAANLAREGIEVVRNIRDSNWLKIDAGVPGVSWNDGLFQSVGGVMDYTAVAAFNSTTGIWSLNFDDSDQKIYYDSATSLYLQPQPSPPPSTIKETPFNRLITLTPIMDGTNQVGIDVVSHVQWGEAGRTHEIKQEEKLYNWRLGVQ